MIIGKAIYAGGAGGMKPEILIIAEPGSTLWCGLQSYVLGDDETQHAFTVSTFGRHSCAAVKGDKQASEWVLVDSVARFTVELEYITDVTATLTGTGSAIYCYATIGGTKRYGDGTYTVQPGDTITFGVYGRSSTYYGEVEINNSQMLKVTNQTTETYVWTVPSGISSVAVNFSYTSTSSQRNGKITVTTS